MKRVLAFLLAALIALGAGLAARRLAVSAVRVEGTSMNDTLRAGDVALMLRAPFEPKRGDIVECRFARHTDTNLKRVIGLPFEEIAFVSGTLYVNGVPVDEPYVSSPTEDYAVCLGADEYLLLGDNRAESHDSRAPDMGFVRREQIVGRAIFILFPLNRIGKIK